MKECIDCKEAYPHDHYYKGSTCAGGRVPRCRACHKRRYPAVKGSVKKDAALWSRYRIRLPDYQRMVDEQGNRCAICQTTNKGRKNSSYWAVDHDHATGAVRGLLCLQCNLDLYVLEQTEWCVSAHTYLETHKLKEVKS